MAMPSLAASTPPVLVLNDGVGDTITIDSSGNAPICVGSCATTAYSNVIGDTTWQTGSGVTGYVTWSGTLGNYSISGAAGQSKPYVGSAADPGIDLGFNYLMNNGTGTGTLTAEWSDVGFTSLGSISLQASDTFGATGTVQYSGYANTSNTLLGLTTQLVTAPATNVNVLPITGLAPLSSPYSLTLVAAITLGSTEYFSDDAQVTGTPSSSGGGQGGPPPSPLTVKCPSSTATVGVAYSSQITVTGGTPPYTFKVVLGSLPAGLTLNTTTGAITGIPTTAGQTGAFKIEVTDSSTPPQVAYTNCSGSCSNGTTVSYGGGGPQSGWGQKGSSSTYSSNGIPLTVYGWTTSGRPAYLYSNNVGGNSYLGIWNNSSNNQIDSGHFVQCDFSSHISAGATGGSITVTGSGWNTTYDVYGSNTLGQIGTLIAHSVPANSWSQSGSTLVIPNFGQYRYICVKPCSGSGTIQICNISCDYHCACAIDVAQSGNNQGGGQGGYGGGQGGYGGGQGGYGGGQGGQCKQGQSPGQCGW
jgi:hypothetical protein